jgi:hypothetical protein
MLKRVAVTGLFPTHDLALRAGEKLREIVGWRGLVRVLFPGAPGAVVQLSVVSNTNGTPGVAAVGAILGVFGFAAMLALGSSWAMAFVALAWGLAAGGMLAWWLVGTTQTARTLRGFDARRCREMLAGTQSAVVVVVAAARRGNALRAAIEAGEGKSFEGVNPWVAIAVRAPIRIVEAIS